MSDLVLSTRLIADSRGFRRELQVVKQELARVGAGTKGVGQAARQTATDLDRVGTGTMRVGQNARQAATGLDRVEKVTRGVGQAARGAAADLDRMGREARETARRTLRLSAGMGGMGGMFGMLKGQVLGLTSAWLSFRGALSATRVIADFQSSMSGVAAVTSATAAEMEILTRTARGLGAATSF